MKRIFTISIVTFLLFFGIQGFSQSPVKLGHIDSQALLSVMPERNTAQNELKKFAEDLQDQMEIMQVEYNKKLNELNTKKDSLSDFLLKEKQKELLGLQQRIQEFQVNAQQELQKKEADLFKPIMEKAQKAIKEVAQEGGFTYIFDSNSLLYLSENSIDILGLVKKKLGIGG